VSGTDTVGNHPLFRKRASNIASWRSVFFFKREISAKRWVFTSTIRFTLTQTCS
jgi:hypothetical protein